MQLINRYYDDLLAGHLGINKIRKLVAGKYHWPMLCKDIEAYVQEDNVCLTLKIVRHKHYGDLQSLLVLTHY